MSKHLLVYIRSESAGTTYRIVVAEGSATARDQHGSVRDAEAVLSWLERSLTKSFDPGDTVEYGDVEYGSVEEALQAVRASRARWEAPSR